MIESESERDTFFIQVEFININDNNHNNDDGSNLSTFINSSSTFDPNPPGVPPRPKSLVEVMQGWLSDNLR